MSIIKRTPHTGHTATADDSHQFSLDQKTREPVVRHRSYLHTIGSFGNAPTTVITDRPLGSYASSERHNQSSVVSDSVARELDGTGHRCVHGTFGGPARVVTYSRPQGAYDR